MTDQSEPDQFGTIASSLVPMDLIPEPEGYDEPEDAGGDEPVSAPMADLSGAPIPDLADPLPDDLDPAADLQLLREVGDRDGD